VCSVMLTCQGSLPFKSQAHVRGLGDCARLVREIGKGG